MIRQKYPEYHPIMAIAEMAHDTTIEDPKLKLDCHKTIARYVTPELKSVEVKAELRETRRVVVSLFDGEIAEGQVLNGEHKVLESTRVLADLEDTLAENLIASQPEALAA